MRAWCDFVHKVTIAGVASAAGIVDSLPAMQSIDVIDSHTGGEPTRLVVAGGPDLGDGDLSERRDRLEAEFDHLRRAVVHEPRGSEVLVGGLLCDSPRPDCAAGIVFFNTAGYLGMCGHGTIGLVRTLAFLGRLEPGAHGIDTPVGPVRAELLQDGRVAVRNVESRRHLAGVAVDVPGLGSVTGDVAWGGNWFFLVTGAGFAAPALEPANARALTEISLAIRDALREAGVTGEGGALIDHVELFGPPRDPVNHSRSFVLCPGGAYDRSPCGTGTSAKLACLAADGRLEPGAIWRQESVIGSVFAASYERGAAPGAIAPTIVGEAHVTARATLLLEDDDPFRHGFATGEALP